MRTMAIVAEAITTVYLEMRWHTEVPSNRSLDHVCRQLSEAHETSIGVSIESLANGILKRLPSISTTVNLHKSIHRPIDSLSLSPPALPESNTCLFPPVRLEPWHLDLTRPFADAETTYRDDD